MSQDLREQESERKDIIYTSGDNRGQKNYTGFEGMNYEQIRQPYNPGGKGRGNSADERGDRKRPDEC